MPSGQKIFFSAVATFYSGFLTILVPSAAKGGVGVLVANRIMTGAFQVLEPRPDHKPNTKNTGMNLLCCSMTALKQYIYVS